ncbi:MAG: Uma2 family endonuclease [Opitutaceae bacterium]|nr:Uma2 family endonuclease [Opitutaceae bacterium]
MPATQAPPVTRHDFALLPEGPPYSQLIEGDLYMAPSPNFFHQDIALNLGGILRNYLGKHPVGKAVIAPFDVYLSDLNVYEPDLLFVRKENLGIIKEHGVEGAPDLVIEILSPSTAKYDLGLKRAIYARTGVEELWIIDPARHTLALYRLGEDAATPVATFGKSQSFSSTLFPGLTIALADVFIT